MKYIVITSIFGPTRAVEKFNQKKEFSLIVVGDKKSPADWNLPGCTYLSVEKQSALNYQINKELPFNHYCRKMIGYLYAVANGAEVIIDTDDDNIPYDNWSVPSFHGDFMQTDKNLGFINIYKNFTEQEIWPRGFPLLSIKDPSTTLKRSGMNIKKVEIGVWQALADGDPDVDAIYRLTSNQECFFEKGDPIVLNSGTICPYNSQNTAYRKELFPLLYLPCFVTFRFTDILRGLVAQPIMWARGFHLGFTEATVLQERNPHNYLKDFESEIPMYLEGEKIIDKISSKINSGNSVEENLLVAYETLVESGIVPREELNILGNWLNDLKSFGK